MGLNHDSDDPGRSHPNPLPKGEETAAGTVGMLIGAAIAAAVVIGLLAVMRIDSSGEQGSGLSKSFDYDLDAYRKIDPAWIKYVEKATVPLAMREPRAVAVGIDDRIYIAGDKAACIFKADGTKMREIVLEEEPQCLAVGGSEHVLPGRLYVGMKDHVEVFDKDGKQVGKWARQDAKRTMLTSIAVGEEDILVADAGALVVWRYDHEGKVVGSIGKRDEARGIAGFIVPSPYFDVAMAPDGLLRVVNPGWHRIEAFTIDGHREASWGKRGMGLEAFCGCCNPSHIAMMPDGRVVTSEKGILRVKVYGASGEFEGVVVGPETLTPNASAAVETRDDLRIHPADVAVDSRGRVLVLDGNARCVRIYEAKNGVK